MHTQSVRDLIDLEADQGGKCNHQVAAVYSITGRWFDRFICREIPLQQESVQRLLGILKGV